MRPTAATARIAEAPAAPFLYAVPTLDAVQQRVLRSLQGEGIAVVPFHELFGDSPWAELEADVTPFVRESEERFRDVGAKPAKKDEFIVRRFHRTKNAEGKQRFSLDSPWLRVGSSDAVLDIVNSYRQQWTKLFYVDNWYTVPYPGADKRVASQRWHRDPEEENVVKVFLYLRDVDEEAGPFEYVRGSFTGGRYGDFWPWNANDRHPPEHELLEAIAPEDQLTLTGSAGTMIFCDTGGFHRGGFARTKPRILSIWSYVSTSTGKGHRFVVDFDDREAQISAKTRFALD